MKTMVDLGSAQRGPLHIIDTPTSVDCARDVRFRRSFRTLVACMVPACCAFPDDDDPFSTDTDTCKSPSSSTSTVTCTFFGHRRSRVSFCIQDDARSAPLLLLELAVPTSYLAREMQHGLLRIALEESPGWPCCSLYDVPLWCIYCNGRKVGFATARRPTPADAAVLRLMRSVSAGAGVLPEDDGTELMYLRATFDRVVGSPDSESFHMINPVGSSGQELSVFLLRS